MTCDDVEKWFMYLVIGCVVVPFIGLGISYMLREIVDTWRNHD